MKAIILGATGASGRELQHIFAQAAAQNGVSRYVLISAQMANPQAKAFYPRLKGSLEQAVSQLSFEHIAILRPPLLIRPNSDHLGEKFAEQVLAVLNKCGLFRAYQPLRVVDLVAVMKMIALQNQSGKQIFEPSDIRKMIQAA